MRWITYWVSCWRRFLEEIKPKSRVIEPKTEYRRALPEQFKNVRDIRNRVSTEKG
jgi:hypothetical protein